jgi:hypothetical protein
MAVIELNWNGKLIPHCSGGRPDLEKSTFCGAGFAIVSTPMLT